jgi:hypothetical protein
LEYLDGTWFHTWRWPGIALLFFIGVCPALVVVATLLRLRIAIIGHVSVGVGLVAWILLKAAWVVVSPGLQGTFGVIGLVIFVLGLREASPGDARRGNVSAGRTGVRPAPQEPRAVVRPMPWRGLDCSLCAARFAPEARRVAERLPACFA